MSETIEQKCISKGIKLTDQRKVIAKVMSESKETYGEADHPDVDELYNRVSKIDPKISIATVYRTVKIFEEAGILIAYRDDGTPFDPSYSVEREKFVDYRNRLNSGESILDLMCQTEKLTLATERLAYLAHWITPKIEKRRYTTRFFVAIAPSGQEGLHDGSESVNSLWIKPEEALQQQEEGKLLLIMPTIKNLQSICGYSNVEELLQDKSSIDPSTIPTIEPKFFMEDGKMVGLLPGDEGYEDH